MNDLRGIIRHPLFTEKMTDQEAENKYAFVVDRRASKIQIAKAVEEMFDVSVVDVHTCIMHGKVKRLGRFSGKRADWKKAIVRLRDGDTIELFEGA